MGAFKIGDEVYIHGYIDEIRKDVIIISNDGGYFGTVENELVPVKQDEWCKDCKEYDAEKACCPRFNKVIRETLKEIRETVGEQNEGENDDT